MRWNPLRRALGPCTLVIAAGCSSSGSATADDAALHDALTDAVTIDVTAIDTALPDVPVVMDTSPAVDTQPVVDVPPAVDVPAALDISSAIDVLPDAPDVQDVPYDPTIYVAPTGSGMECSMSVPCSLPTAVTVARTRNSALTADLNVVLADGTYTLSAPLVFAAADSGSNSHAVVYQAAAGAHPVVSGGVTVNTSWTLGDATNNIWQTTVDPSIHTRHMYVNGVRAVRARTPDLPAGFTQTATGFTAPDASMATWGNLTSVEFVGYFQWKSFRCDVASITGTAVTLDQPCWTNSQAQAGYTFSSVQWIENARELLDAEGEFYLDSTSHVLSYKPRTGEDLTTASVVLPVLETLVQGSGTPDAPVHDITFRGLTFAYATWLQPSTTDGYVCLQAGVTDVGAPTSQVLTPGNLTFTSAHGITFENDVFTHLGGAGLALERGSQSNTVQGCVFEDISGSAITVGDVTLATDSHPTDPRTIVSNNTLEDSFVTATGVDYPDTPAVMVGFTNGTVVDHNDLFNLPYTGVSVGWGWGSVDPGGGTYTTPAESLNNAITNNVIGYHMRTMIDGGGIYVLGAQPGSVMHGNYLNNQGNNYGTLYLDNGTQFYTVSSNVVAFVPHWLYVQVYAPTARNNIVTGNWSDADTWFQPVPIDPSNMVSANTVTGGTWPAAAQAVMNAAGLPTAYVGLHPPDVALGGTASASSVYAAAYVASMANDGNMANGWSASATDTMPWWQVDLGTAYDLRGVEVATRWDIDQGVTRTNFAVWASNDPSFATRDVIGSVGPAGVPYRAVWSERIAGGTRYRYVRVVKTMPGYFYLGEVRVLGLP